MKFLLVLSVVLSVLAVSYAAPARDALTNFQELERVHNVVHDLKEGIDSEVSAILTEATDATTRVDFLQANTKFRRVLEKVINFNDNETETLSRIEAWIFAHRPASLTLNDVKIGIRRAVISLKEYKAETVAVNNRRIEAIRKPAIEDRRTEMKSALSRFRWISDTLTQVSEQLADALYDFKTFISES